MDVLNTASRASRGISSESLQKISSLILSDLAHHGRSQFALNDREDIGRALREKPLKLYEVMKRANVANEKARESSCC